MRRILLLAEKFPPHQLSGTARPFYFAKYLPEFGYEPLVVASRVLPGEQRDDAQLGELPDSVSVRRIGPWLAPMRGRGEPRSGAGEGADGRLSVTRRLLLELGQRAYWYLDWSAPAILGAVRAARAADCELIWVTAPHARNYLIGHAVARILGKPLIIDMRDPWTYGPLWTPPTPSWAREEAWWAQQVLAAASLIITTSPLTTAEMQRRFPGSAERFATIPNGFEPQQLDAERNAPGDRCLLRYVGSFGAGRSPEPLLAALRQAIDAGLDEQLIWLDFVGNFGGHDALIERYDLSACVSLTGHVPQRRSLELMRGSDVNLCLQTLDSGNDVIAGKMYEYLAAGRAVLALVDPSGGDAWLLNETNFGVVADPGDTASASAAITKLVEQWQRGELPSEPPPGLIPFSRRALTERLARLLDEL